MSEVELILTALMTGAAAGTTAAAQSAVTGAYTVLRDVLRRALIRHGRLDGVLDAVEAQPGTWQADLGRVLADAHADRDAQVLEAARALLAAADPAGWQAGKYRMAAPTISGGHVGDTVNQVTTNSGAVGEFHASVSFGAPAVPPAQPGVA